MTATSPTHRVRWSLSAGLALAGLISSAAGQDFPPPLVIAWNDLGMHCMDPDYSIFTILPPFNTVNAQLMVQGELVENGLAFNVTYRSELDASASINTTSIGKTNFWDHVDDLFGVSLPLDVGLAGNAMPGPLNVPQPMHFDPTWTWFQAEGIPLTPIDDNAALNTYPLMRVTAHTNGGSTLASTVTSVPVSQELECSMCHASATSPFAMPAMGWVFDSDPDKDDRRNILAVHDDRHLNETAFVDALIAAGYSPLGLRHTAESGTAVLCATCHGSNALPGTGQPGVSPLTSAIHGFHADVVDAMGTKLGTSTTRDSCFTCHPGRVTQCLRGAMGKAIGADGDFSMQCQSCHGGMDAVGDPGRVGWLEQPSCQECHTGTATDNAGAIRFTSVFDDSGNPHVATNAVFATTSDVPAAGFDLYRFSDGHGGLQCSACHGSPHAIYPSSFANDNVQSQAIQGHSGTISDCASCHVPDFLEHADLGGPHGMHDISAKWAKDQHGDVASNQGIASCRACHGSNLRGTVLSRTQADRAFPLGSEFGTKTFFEGANVTCFACHNGPFDNDATNNHAPQVTDLSLSVPTDVALPVVLPGNDVDGDSLDWRIVSQPTHGTVAFDANGTTATATYRASDGYVGRDEFTYAAFDGSIDSALGRITIDVIEPVCQGKITAYGFGCPGTGGLLPILEVTGCAQAGADLAISIAGGYGGADGLLLLGGGQSALMMAGGCVLRVAPLLPLQIPIALEGTGGGAGTFDLPVVIPAAVTGITVTMQALLGDPAGVGVGFTSTNAVELVFP